ncbi:MAG: hypothetical protein H6836_06205 [Planctomycetes bacterium]|nr:hypothetical protein [Planctomycetota bacterium]
MKKLGSTILLVLFLTSAIAGIAIPLMENPGCDCKTDCWKDGNGKHYCLCWFVPCDVYDDYCQEVERGTGAFGPIFFCMCGPVDWSGNPPEYENMWWEAECLCKHKFEIGNTTGNCYPLCDTNTCTQTCFRLPEADFTLASQPCCECR